MKKKKRKCRKVSQSVASSKMTLQTSTFIHLTQISQDFADPNIKGRVAAPRPNEGSKKDPSLIRGGNACTPSSPESYGRFPSFLHGKGFSECSPNGWGG